MDGNNMDSVRMCAINRRDFVLRWFKEVGWWELVKGSSGNVAFALSSPYPANH